MGRPPAGGWLARRGAAGPVHGRLPAERLPEHHLHHARRWAHGPGTSQLRAAVRVPVQAGPADRLERLEPARPAAGQLVLADHIPQPGTVLQAGRAAGRGGGRLAAGPRRAERADRGRSRRRRAAAAWCDCANDLAWLRANHPDRPAATRATAVAMARRMVEECPDAAAYWNTLGVAYYRAGD